VFGQTDLKKTHFDQLHGNMELSERIGLVRETDGLTQANMAFELGISPQAYGKIERQAERATIILPTRASINKVSNLNK
jgi:DNA-binding XRE family transcriptional regulator